MINLLEETLEDISDQGLSVQDIVYIGKRSGAHSCSWEEFEILANTLYDNSYGDNEVISDLIIVFRGGQEFHRGEYDGSEWWELYEPFVMPENTGKLLSLFK